ncbi:MAG: thiamine pyrophosphate-dependent enzyme, partial [Gammaproteobacteria bacterium]|nr:thiamine pyrophosphate-dependent enzyme [Gammaproteobacteria bacterium]
MEIKKRSIADAGYDLLLGNEAIVRGAIESNVGFVSIYPGTPISEIGMEIDRNSGEFNIVYEVSVNEKVALESAIGASLSGVRALVAMKHVGLNVASDPLMTLAYIGVRGGLVIITGDDPGCYSSQNEQDNRNYSSFSKVTMLEPSSPEECRMMTKEAFKISEKYNSPVIIRTTTAINHSRGFVSKLSNISKNSNEKGFIKKTNQYVPVPSNARNLHRALVNSINVIQNYADLSELNFHVGSGRLGILTSGYCYNMVMDSLMRLNCEDKFKVYKLGITYPLSELKLLEFVKSVGQVLVIEELSPYLETKLRSIIHKEGLSNKIYGKGFSGLVETGSYSIDQVDDAVREILGWSSITTKSYDVINIIKNIPSRPPILCTGCPHRSTYLTVKFIYRSNAVYSSDIGCYTLGVQEPIEMTDLFTSMGASVSSASGLSLFNDDPVVAFIGDSTFFHSGITGLINAVYNNHNFLLVIMDNEVTAMTGMQNNPGVRLSGRNVNIESIVSGCGVEWCKVIDPNNVQESFRVINESRKVEGIRVIIARSPCALNVMKKPHNEVNYSYRVDTDKCQACHNCSDTTACSTEKSTDYQFMRIDQLLSVEDSN